MTDGVLPVQNAAGGPRFRGKVELTTQARGHTIPEERVGHLRCSTSLLQFGLPPVGNEVTTVGAPVVLATWFDSLRSLPTSVDMACRALNMRRGRPRLKASSFARSACTLSSVGNQFFSNVTGE